MDSNHLKAANLAEKVYKTSLTTKSHSLKFKSIVEDLKLFVKVLRYLALCGCV